MAQTDISLDHVNLEVVFKTLEEWSKMYDIVKLEKILTNTIQHYFSFDA